MKQDIAQELEDLNACDDRCRGRCSKCPNDTIREAVAEIRRVQAHAKALSNALLKVRPLGGSELFVRVGEDFYADPDYCGKAIEKMSADLHEARKAAVLASRDKR